MRHIVKNSGYSELYSRDKYKNSILKTLHAVPVGQQQAQVITDAICHATDTWLRNKHEVSSLDIRVFTQKQLAEHNADAALLYKKYGDIW